MNYNAIKMASNTNTMKMAKFIAYFDFTTVHGKGRFVGRSGQVQIETENSIEQMNADRDQISKHCVAFINSEKPKWNVFMITVKDIIPA